MRLIDADMLLNSFKGSKKLGVDAIKYYVDNAPTIDLVRCGECKKVDTKQCPMYSAGWGYTDEDWCSCRERRAEEQ